MHLKRTLVSDGGAGGHKARGHCRWTAGAAYSMLSLTAPHLGESHGPGNCSFRTPN